MKDEDGFDDEFEEDGYPREDILEKIAQWDANDTDGLIRFIAPYFNLHGGAWWDGELLSLATLGWSGCESIISALDKNTMFTALYWESSHRGGLHIYRIPAK